MQLNQQLEKPLASYVSPNYTIDCSLGVNAFGAPLICTEFVTQLATGVEDYYCHRNLAQLASVTANYIGVSDCHLTFTNGSLAGLELIFNKLLPYKKSMLGIGPQFVEAVSEFKVAGGEYRSVDLLKYPDEEALLKALVDEMNRKATSIVYIDNPNNPTGKILSKAFLRALCKSCAKLEIMLLVDEAYGEYLAEYGSMTSEVSEFDNLLVLRSFSKGLGLAGIRLGYIVSSKALTPYIRQSILPFAPSLPAIKIAHHVLTNLDDYLDNTRQQTQINKSKLLEILSCAGIEVLSTSARTPILLAYKQATNLSEWLKQRNIITASGAHFADTNIKVDHQYARIRIPGCDTDLLQLQRRLAGTE